MGTCVHSACYGRWPSPVEPGAPDTRFDPIRADLPVKSQRYDFSRGETRCVPEERELAEARGLPRLSAMSPTFQALRERLDNQPRCVPAAPGYRVPRFVKTRFRMV